MKKVKTSLKGRKCHYSCCKNILSIYNHEEYCYVHRNILFQDDMVKAMKHGR